MSGVRWVPVGDDTELLVGCSALDHIMLRVPILWKRVWRRAEGDV